MTFPFIPASLLVVGVGSAGYLVWDTFRAETPKERCERFKREAFTNCGIHPQQRSNEQNKRGMDEVDWNNCFEKWVNKFFPTIPLDSYRAHEDLWLTKEEREKQIESICGRNSEEYDVDCWRSINEIINSLEINNISIKSKTIG